MDWSSILNFVFGGTTLCGVVAAIVYRRQNKRIKESEAKQAESAAKVSDVEAKKQEIDLVKYVRDSIFESMEQVKEMQSKGNLNQEEIKKMLRKQQAQLDRQDILLENLQIEQTNQREFLDGPYNEWLAEQKRRKQGQKEVEQQKR